MAYLLYRIIDPNVSQIKPTGYRYSVYHSLVLKACLYNQLLKRK